MKNYKAEFQQTTANSLFFQLIFCNNVLKFIKYSYLCNGKS